MQQLLTTRKKQPRSSVQKDKDTCKKESILLYREFESQCLNVRLDGDFLQFGEYLYLKPKDVLIDGIKTVRPGLCLGICKKGRFEPAHALAKALKVFDYKNVIDFKADDLSLLKYTKGETFACDLKGYSIVACDGMPLGWGKASNGVLKNKLPKGLRIF